MVRSVFPVLGIAAITVASVVGNAPDPVRGREIYLANCATCHGAFAEGDGPAAASLGVSAPDLTQITERHDGKFPYDEMRRVIEGRKDAADHGARVMPVWGDEFAAAAGGGMKGEEAAWQKVEALLAYLESIQADADGAGKEPGPGSDR